VTASKSQGTESRSVNRAWDGVRIVGWGETPYHRRDQRSTVWYLADAVRRALSNAGLPKNAVDGIAVTSFQLPPDNATTFAHHLGIEARWVMQGVHGGASGVASILQATRMIQAGDADVVVCVAGDAFDVEGHMRLLDRFNQPMRDYLGPYPYGGPNGLFALVQSRHMEMYGTKREQLGRLAVAQRQNAQRNPNALLRDPLTLDDYLNARLIAEPLGLYDCVLPCAGAGAVVLAREDHPDIDLSRSLRILAGAQLHNYRPDDVVVLNSGFEAFGEAIFATAGLARDEIDMLQLYDDYPIMALIQLEDLGFAAKGEGGQLLERVDMTVEGDLPINTGGGQLSAGQCGAGGGIIGLVEATRQLLHEAPGRQVPFARTALVAGFGMVGYGRGLSTTAAILGR
jgi:acetyl-CoA acetyltransferase